MGNKEPGVPVTKHEVQMFWDSDADFGAYLKAVRLRKGLSTREAAKAFGNSQAYISKIENLQRKEPPGNDLMERVAEVYGLDMREVMHEAGFRYDVPRSLELRLNIDESFRRLLNEDKFHPSGFDADDERYFSPVVKQQIVDLVLNVARVVRDEGLDVEAWLRGGGAS